MHRFVLGLSLILLANGVAEAKMYRWVDENGEVHYSDAVEERISLSDRFGLWLSFYSPDLNGYLAIVDSYFPDFHGDREALHQAARMFAMTRASHSGRTAKQFYNAFSRSGGGLEAGEGGDT